MRSAYALTLLLLTSPAWAQESSSGFVQALGGDGGAKAQGEARASVGTASPARARPRGLHVDGETIRDETGRVVLLRGVNVGLKKPPFLPSHSELDVRRLVRACGINFVRFSIAWRAVEPSPGRYDRVYLDGMAAAIENWTRAGVYVLVDMHQDVWGGPISSHGAPVWATLARREKPLRLPKGTPWQVRYFDRRVYLSFEALYANQRVPATGLGLAEHYARAWSVVARRLASNPLVVGYDPLNEPFYGKEICAAVEGLAIRTAPSAFVSGARALWRSVVHGEDLQQTFTRDLVERLQNPQRYASVASGLAAANRRVHARLARLYARVGRAIRRHDPDALLFVEPVGPVGAGAPVSLPGIGLGGVVYAPHLYDAFMDSGQPYDGDLRRVTRTLRQHQDAARRLGAPLVLGEWGNLVSMARSSGGRAGVTRFARDLGAALDRGRVGSAYWEHTPGAESDALVQEALRPSPPAVAGRITELRWDARARVLTVGILPERGRDAATVIPFGSAHFPDGVTVERVGADAEIVVDGEARQVRVRPQGWVRVRLRAR
jgi:endoglycosylceramidase